MEIKDIKPKYMTGDSFKRTINGSFTLYDNHSRISKACVDLGFVGLPNIIWRKQTNAPNKFMGSGMLPCGAYVTLEHEYILIFRKGCKREYRTAEDKLLRMESSYFWEEQKMWFLNMNSKTEACPLLCHYI